MWLRVYSCFCLSLVLLLGISPLRADVTGSVSGYVRDKSGAVLPNASVTATRTATGYTRTVTTDATGAFSIVALPPGQYKLTSSAQGFRQGVIDNIDLKVNDALRFEFTLQPGGVSETVSVEADALQIQTTTTSMGSVIESNQILAMPLNGRSSLDLLSLQAGVSPISTNSGYTDRAPASGLYSSSGPVSRNGQPDW